MQISDLLIYSNKYTQFTDYIKALLLKCDIMTTQYKCQCVPNAKFENQILETYRNILDEVKKTKESNKEELFCLVANAFGIFYMDINKYSDALSLLENVKEIVFKNNRHERNPYIDSLDKNIAICYSELNMPEKANFLFDEITMSNEQYLENSSKNKHSLELERGISLSMQGKHEEAAKILVRAYKECCNEFGENDLLTIKLNYAHVLQLIFLDNITQPILQQLTNILDKIEKYHPNERLSITRSISNLIQMLENEKTISDMQNPK